MLADNLHTVGIEHPKLGRSGGARQDRTIAGAENPGKSIYPLVYRPMQQILVPGEFGIGMLAIDLPVDGGGE
ncbi:MAG: hypothetical protein ACD_75C01840G0002 [uncultured bacterium]|nr:MAG: hypothetical protein ACD_75C01840G0002 [uncultured bacterium]